VLLSAHRITHPLLPLPPLLLLWSAHIDACSSNQQDWTASEFKDTKVKDKFLRLMGMGKVAAAAPNGGLSVYSCLLPCRFPLNHKHHFKFVCLIPEVPFSRM
jgi:hypothetical protein